VDAWKANPKGLAVGGGSSPGGPDHLLSMQLAKTVGIGPKQANSIAYDGGGDLLPAVLVGKVAFGASGFEQFLDQVEADEVQVWPIEIAGVRIVLGQTLYSGEDGIVILRGNGLR
jgi:putative tricarboxylic transport membrane protein